MDERSTVLGGTVAALVAADGIATAGGRVRLMLPRTGTGGGFATLERGGRLLQQGMRVLELEIEGAQRSPAIEDYRPGELGHKPHLHLVDAWLRELVGDDAVVAVDPPTSFMRGAPGPEIYLSSDLSGAATMVPGPVARRIAFEAALARRREGSAGLLATAGGTDLAASSFEAASVRQHGATFHDEFLSPFVDKVLPGGSSVLAARSRRKAWVPLFWPSTVAEAFSGARIGYHPHRPLSVVRPGGTGRIVQALLDRLHASPRVLVEHHHGIAAITAGARGVVDVRFVDGGLERLSRPVLALPTGEFFAAHGIPFSPERVRSVLAWLEVDERDLLTLPGFVHVIDPSVAAYRVSAGEVVAGTSSRVVCVELAHDVERDDAGGAALEVLVKIGMVSEAARVTTVAVFAGPTFSAPTRDLLDAHASAIAAWHESGVDAEVVGGALVAGSDGFNEQVVQGLRVAALRGGAAASS